MSGARDPAVAAALRAEVRGEVREAEPLSRYSTYRIGGPATVFIPVGVEDVSKALAFATERGIPWLALGLGSNVLLPDEGLDAVVIRVGKGLDAIRSDGPRWWIGAGLPAPLAARRTAEAGFGGLHKMVGVPGSVGGGVYMNAGCHGAQWSDVTRRVTVAEADGEVWTIEARDIPFTYRRSGLDRRVVLEVEVDLAEDDPERLRAEVAALFRWRQQGTPFNQPCCGSVFKNPGGPRTAGQLIEAAGLKGRREGGAEVSPMHANYFVNTGGATAGDVRRLIDLARTEVRTRFGVELETEVKVIGTDGRYVSP